MKGIQEQKACLILLRGLSCTSRHLKKIDFMFQSSQVHSKIEGRYRDFPYPPFATRAQPPSLSPSSTRGVRLLQLMHLYGHVSITQSPQFTMGFTLGVVQSSVLDKCVMPYIHHYKYHKEQLDGPKNLLCSAYSSLPTNPCQPLTFLLSPQFYLFQSVTQSDSYGTQPFFFF